jgi:hypothetical protein
MSKETILKDCFSNIKVILESFAVQISTLKVDIPHILETLWTEAYNAGYNAGKFHEEKSGVW